MKHISEIIEDILVEWAYRVHDGMPNPTNPQHIIELRESMEELNLPNNVIYQVIENLINEVTDEETKFKARSAETKKIIYFKNQDNLDKALDSGTAIAFEKDNGGEETEKEDDTGKLGADDFDTEKSGYLKKKSDKKDGEEKTDTSVAISKVNDKRFGVLKKKETALENEYIGEEDAKKLDEFNQDINEFLKNPTKEAAEALSEKYKLSQNASGSKLYLGFIAGDMRKILGEGNKLVETLGNVLNQFVDLKAKGDVQKRAMDKLQSASKPGLTTVVNSGLDVLCSLSIALFCTSPFDFKSTN